MADKVTTHGILSVQVLSAKGLLNKDGGMTGLSDPYVLICLDNKEVGRTVVISNNLNPKWKAEFEFDCVGEHSSITFDVWNKNRIFKDDFLGRVQFGFKDILSHVKFNDKFQLRARTSADQVKGVLHLKIRYRPHTRLDSYEVRRSAFPMRRGCNVTLFQDAHVCETELPPQFADVKEWLIPNNAFEEIYTAIVNARKFIYITGWSVNPAISLLRRRSLYGDQMLTMGDLLRMKADVEGVKVLLHLWDEKLSMDIGPFTTSGVMSTFDEITKQYFQDSRVTVKLSYRTGSFTGELYWSHHQKTVILDAPITNPIEVKVKPGKKMKPMGTRRVVAFVGGLDLTSGRWDTPAHSLFKSLKLEHKDDYHQPWKIPQDHGPRQPWHDIHTKVEGMIARDVLSNFEQRWKKQASDIIHAGALYDIKGDRDIVEDKKEKGKKSADPEAWNVQLFRSIDHHSAILPPVKNNDGTERKATVERGIQDAYINAIRVAKQFIYIENQYFMGSSPAWSTERDSGCNNGIPVEIATKIATSIQNGRPFYAYIVLPIFPEGVPSEKALQEMLRWQWLTMEMMYKKIGDAIKQYGPGGAHPTDFLNFYCLGNREKVDGPAAPPLFLPPKTKRFMIYVHSKLLIADDEYILCGSANINERSMAGDRDSEIVVGAYQPNKKSAEQEPVRPGFTSAWNHPPVDYTQSGAFGYGSNYYQQPYPQQPGYTSQAPPPQPDYPSQVGYASQAPPPPMPGYPPQAPGYDQYGYQSGYQQQQYPPQQQYSPQQYPPQQPGYSSQGAPGFSVDPYQSGYGNFQYPPQQSYPPPPANYYNSGYAAPGNNPGFPVPAPQSPYPGTASGYGPAPGYPGYPPAPGYQSGYPTPNVGSGHYQPQPGGYPSPGYPAAAGSGGYPGGGRGSGGSPGGYPGSKGSPGYPGSGRGSSGYPGSSPAKGGPPIPTKKPLPTPNYNRNPGIPQAELKAIEHPVYGTLPAVKRFRLSLWAEHTSTFMADFMQPNNVETVRKINALAEANWKVYASDTISEMTSHLMKYPIDVDTSGKITPKCQTFPDTTANIVGSSSALIPNLITQ